MWARKLFVNIILAAALLAQSSEAFQPLKQATHSSLFRTAAPTTRTTMTPYKLMPTSSSISSLSSSLLSGSKGDDNSHIQSTTPVKNNQPSTKQQQQMDDPYHQQQHPPVWWKPCLALGGLALTTSAAMLMGGNPAFAAAEVTSHSITSQTTAWWSSIAETGFYQAFSLVFLSEIGDKTFFIAGLLAMKTSKLISFVGSMAALGVMTVISVLIGQIFHAVPSGFITDGLPLDDIAACLAFAFFGFKTLKEALAMEEGESTMDEELAEAQEAVDQSRTIREVTKFGQVASIFALVFAAEFGDRSFLSTIALSAAQNPFSVCAGGIAAHAAATGIAVSGGSYIAKYISEKVIGIIGGTLFIAFAITTAIGIF